MDNPENRSDSPLLCHRCGGELQSRRGELYVVRNEAFADPTVTITKEDLQKDIEAEIKRLIEAASHLSDQEAMETGLKSL